MLQSFYSKLFEYQGKYYIFNSERVLFAEVPKELFVKLYNREYEEIPNEVVSQLVEVGFLNQNQEDESNYFENEHFKFLSNSYNPNILSLVIVPTTACNFSCPYCFEGKKGNKTMSEEIENKIIEHIKSYTYLDRINLTWYGGEPLLAIKVMKSLYAKILSLDLKIGAHEVITNGYLINEETIDFFKEAEIKKVQITLDGIEEHHNLTRYLHNGEPTYSKIIENIKILIEHLRGSRKLPWRGYPKMTLTR